MRQTFLYPNKPNSAKKSAKIDYSSTILECFGVFWSGLEGLGTRGGEMPVENKSGSVAVTSHIQRQNSGWGVPADRFKIFQFVANFVTGRNRNEG